jgi:hypothetical protein
VWVGERRESVLRGRVRGRGIGRGRGRDRELHDCTHVQPSLACEVRRRIIGRRLKGEDPHRSERSRGEGLR